MYICNVIYEFSNVAGYKINCKTIIFLYTSNKQLEVDVLKYYLLKIPFIIASKY